VPKADYLQAVQNLLRAYDMDWRRPAAETPTGRAFTNITRRISLVIIAPEKLTAEERVAEIQRFQDLFSDLD